MHNCDASCKFDNPSRAHLLHHVQQRIPTKITHKQLHLLPQRADYLDQNMYAMFRARVNKGGPLLFMPNDILEKPEWSRELGASVYKIYMFGVLPCGSKTLVILDDVPVFFDIQVGAGSTVDQFEQVLRGQFSAGNITCERMERVFMFSMDGFQKDTTPYLRLHFNNLADRKTALEFVDRINEINVDNGRPELITASNDLGMNNYYISKVAREYKFNTADWNGISKYSVISKGTISDRCEYTLRVSVADLKALTAERRVELTAPTSPLCKLIDFDPTMVMQWDIETWSNKADGSPPTVDDEYIIFNICGAYFWQWSEDPLVRVCAIMNNCTPKEHMDIVIECDTERDVIVSHMTAMGAMSHDISSAFNGSHFDWPLYREKCKQYKLLVQLKSHLSSFPLVTRGKWADTEANVFRWNFRKDKVKIDATNDCELDCVAQFPGILDTDVSPVFLKMYSRAEIPKMAGLNFYLKSNKIPVKEDMPYKRMFRIYERSCLIRNVTECHCESLHAKPVRRAGDLITNTPDWVGPKNCQCGVCIPSIDCKPAADSHSEDNYTNEPLDSLVDEQGRPKCCFCGKKPQNARDMADVGYYCIIDCVRPQQLYVRRMIIPDKRELSTMSYVSLNDSFYRADGMKVRNLIGAYCADVNMAFSNKSKRVDNHNRVHYPGAWVFPPNRGLHSDNFVMVTRTRPDGTTYKQRLRCRPITGLDFNSLYPSIMMTNNLSPDRIVETQELHDQLVAEGYKLYRIEPITYEIGETKGAIGNQHKVTSGWTVRHNGVTRTDTKIIEKYLKKETYTLPSGTKIVYATEDGPTAEQAEELAAARAIDAKITRTIAYDEIRGRDALPGESMGLFPSIVKRLFDMRVPIKREFVRFCILRERMEKEGLKTIDVVVNGHTVTMTMSDVKFTIAKVDAKQKALKVLANTFYGESGNCRSSVYKLLVAAGVTSCGQYNIKMIAKMCEELGYIVHYGDTDSVYLACPDELFAECDAEYERGLAALALEFAGVANVPEPAPDTPEAAYKDRRIALRVAWWTKQVEISMADINVLKEKVGDKLLADNGTRYLNMAYEEVLYPTVMTGKKKYYGNEHIDDVNFDKTAAKHFVKGIDVVKQGQAEITKDLGYDFMLESILPRNELGLLELAEARIRKYYNMDIDPSKFVLWGKYKPDKRNVPMHKFHARMAETSKRYRDAGDLAMAALYEPPEAGDKFQYVITKKEQPYTLQGKKIELKKGDIMEYMRVYRARDDIVIDTDWYMSHMIAGVFARFIAYHENFQPPEGRYDLTDKDQYEEYDKFCVKEANKYIINLCDTITGFDKTAQAKIGTAYKSIYKTAHAAVHQTIPMYAKSIFSLDIHSENTTTTQHVIDQIKAQAAEYACCDADYGREYVSITAEENLSAFKISRALLGTRYQIGAAKAQLSLCDRTEQAAMSTLYTNIRPIIDMLQTYEGNISRLVDSKKLNDENAASIVEISDEQLDAVDKINDSIRSLKSAYRIRAQLKCVLGAIEREKAKISGDVKEPTTDYRVLAAADAAAIEGVAEYRWK